MKTSSSFYVQIVLKITVRSFLTIVFLCDIVNIKS